MKLIVDVDTGVDDAAAILLALNNDNVEIVAITCVSGNTTLSNVTVNTLRLLQVCKRLDIPVYNGCNKIWLGTMGSPETGFHGLDGMGDTETEDVDLSLVKTEHAAQAMVRLANERPGEIVLFACGPLTNVAMALRLDEHFGTKLKSATIMGGNTEGRGNYKIGGEFNFAADPEAAMIALNELKCPISILTMEVGVIHGFTKDWFKRWFETDTDLGRFVKRVFGVYLYNMRGRQGKIAIYDAIAMATLLNPDIVLEVERQYCTVECEGKHARGMMIIDWKGHLEKEPNVDIITKIDEEKLSEMMMKSIARVV